MQEVAPLETEGCVGTQRRQRLKIRRQVTPRKYYLANNLLASSCDNRRPIIPFGTWHLRWLQQTNLWRKATSPWTSAERLRDVWPYPSRRAKGPNTDVRPALPTGPGLSTAGAIFRPCSNEATYGLRKGGARFHPNRPIASNAKPTLSADIVRRVRNADGFYDEVLKRYGLPKPMIERALMEVYRTVVLDQENN